MNGILNLLKPPGMTSHDAVSFVRRVYGLKRVGHAGTLDPAAAGVLPVFLGKATRLLEYTLDSSKEYRAEITFGFETDTADDTGKVVTTGSATLPDESTINSVLQSFIGVNRQIPPMYSAVKIGGKKLYELARAGIEANPAAREIYINDIRLLDISDGKLLIDVDCSKGTYIRTLCRDIGRRLGCPATMSFLVRTRAGLFKLQNAYTPKEVVASPMSVLQEADNAILHLDKIMLDSMQALDFLQGRTVTLVEAVQSELLRVYDAEKRLMGIGKAISAIQVRPIKVLMQHAD